MSKKITEHEGNKYLREIRSCLTGEKIQVDVYDVIRAFGITCPAQAHVIKKLLCAGKRGKGSELDDLIGADAALSRAIEECNRDKEEEQKTPGPLQRDCNHAWEGTMFNGDRCNKCGVYQGEIQ